MGVSSYLMFVSGFPGLLAGHVLVDFSKCLLSSYQVLTEVPPQLRRYELRETIGVCHNCARPRFRKKLSINVKFLCISTCFERLRGPTWSAQVAPPTNLYETPINDSFFVNDTQPDPDKGVLGFSHLYIYILV